MMFLASRRTILTDIDRNKAHLTLDKLDKDWQSRQSGADAGVATSMEVICHCELYF